MSQPTTTEILFNSPALRSLKRDQLVRLCKTHSLKANGKNVELIERLKQHATTLPKDAPLSVAVRSQMTGESYEDVQVDTQKDDAEGRERPTSYGNRTSDQWEMVMDSIAEEEEDSYLQGSLRSLRAVGNGSKDTGEFGTTTTKASTLRTFASSLTLGLKRGPTASSSKSSETIASSSRRPVRDSFDAAATPYDEIPPGSKPIEVEDVLLNPARMSMTGYLSEGETPLPGHALRPGVPAPDNARLSMGSIASIASVPTTPRRTQPTTTIRLVGGAPASNVFETPRLKPFKTDFDIVMGSPGPQEHVWGNVGGLYPKLTAADLPPPSPFLPSTFASPRVNSASEHVTATGLEALGPPPTKLAEVKASDDPFIFGSPLSKHGLSNAQFGEAARGVLEEMNRRLQSEGVDSIDTSIVERLHPGTSNKESQLKATVGGGQAPSLRDKEKAEIKQKFTTAHEKEFEKMEGIDGMLKRKAALASASSAQPAVGSKRKSVMLDDASRQPVGPSTTTGKRSVNDARRRKAIPGGFGMDNDESDADGRSEQAEEDASPRKRARMSPAGERRSTTTDRAKAEEDRARVERERAIIKKKLEANKARRRSSLASSRGGISGIGTVTPKPKAKALGFLSSAKSLVASVWGRNKPKEQPTPKPSTLAKPTSTLPSKPSVTTVFRDMPGTATTSKLPPDETAAKAAEGSQTMSRISHLSHLAATTSSSRAAPSAAHLPPRKAATVGASGSRVPSTGKALSPHAHAGTSRTASIASRITSPTPVPAANSLGARPTSGLSAATAGTRQSRLLAPTASSLAKMGSKGPITGRTGTLQPKATLGEGSKALEPITNTTRRTVGLTPRRGVTPRATKIFSTPLQIPSVPAPTDTTTTAAVKDAMSPPPVTPVDETAGEAGELKSGSAVPQGTTGSRTGRKPRISRSMVAARLAAQRAAAAPAAGASSTLGATPSAAASTKVNVGTPVTRSSSGVSTITASGKPGVRVKTRSSLSGAASGTAAGGRTRSSIGVGVAGRRKSGVPGTSGTDTSLLMSAKKKARQSEIQRRKGRAVGTTSVARDASPLPAKPGVPAGSRSSRLKGKGMEVDA